MASGLKGAKAAHYSKSSTPYEEFSDDIVEFDVNYAGQENRQTQDNFRPPDASRLTTSLADVRDGDIGNSSSCDLGPPSASYSSEIGGQKGSADGETYTIEDAIERFGYGRFQLRVTVLAGLSWTADAMEMMVLAILGPALKCEWGLRDWEIGLINAIVFVGMMFGSSLWGSFSDKFGRRMTLIVTGVLSLYYGLLSALALSLGWLLVFRCLFGFGVTGSNQSVTLISEFLPKGVRAKCLVGLEVFFAGGAAFEVFLAYLIMPTLGWRWLLVFSAIPLLIFCVGCKWLPESMRFNLSKGHAEAALRTLEACASENRIPMPKGRLVFKNKEEQHGRLKDLFSPRLLKTTLILWLLWFANTFCYYGIVLFTTELLDMSDGQTCAAPGSDKVESITCSLDCRPLTGTNYLELLWTTAAELPGLVVTWFTVDLLGRKWSFCVQFLLFSLFTMLVAICKGRVFMIFCLFCARGFISGAFQVCFVYTPEVYPTECRSLGIGTCSSFARFGAITTPFIAQVLLHHSLYATLGIYAGCAAAAGFLSLLLPIETKGRQMNESH